MWQYRAKIVKVIDGDTLDVVIDVGFNMTTTQRVRLLGINCPEIKGVTRGDGLRAKDYTEKWVAGIKQVHSNPSNDEWPFVIETSKDDAFGRWLARIYKSEDQIKTSLNSDLLLSGNAVPDIR